MDDIVLQALRKWPNVPACHGWLGLDARGNWYLRDVDTQQQGSFPQAKGQKLEHEKLCAFIGRNYAADAQGQWFFQNGPQRVFVELEWTPLVWRLTEAGQVQSHTGVNAEVRRCLVDEQGRVYMEALYLGRICVGVVHSLDVMAVAEALEQGRWVLHETTAYSLPVQYGFVRSPVERQRSTAQEPDRRQAVR